MHPQRAPMLDYVGRLGRNRSGSAVYLGDRWILTANHAFRGRKGDVVVFSGVEYELNVKGAVRLKNPRGTGLAPLTDLMMVPLKTGPDLPALKLTENTPFAGEIVVLVGYGDTEDPHVKDPLLTNTPNRQSPMMRPISAADGEAAKVHWGENEVAGRDVAVALPGDEGRTKAFVTIRQPHWTPHNAQGASGDSGGGVFVKRGDRWELSGVMLSVIHREDLGASGTFIADLSVYRDQIAKAVPEPSAAAFLFVASGIGFLRRRR